MGVASLVAAFNLVASPALTCDRATMAYEAGDGIQFQRLTFYGTAPDGMAFEIRSDRVRPGADINEAARATAQRLLDLRKPPLEEPPK